MGQVDPGIELRAARAGDLPACIGILRALPDWFGIEASIDNYQAELPSLETIVATARGEILGFLTLKFHFTDSAEIYLIAVRAEHHRHGIGSLLFARAERIVREHGRRFFQVKTLGPSHPSPEYARTRQFYGACGFTALEELPDLWPGNPCLIMIKYLEATQHTSIVGER